MEVVPQVAGGGALVGVPRELELALLDDVRRRGEAGPPRPCLVAKGVAAGVVEMEVRVDHPAHVAGRVTQRAERILELRRATLPSVLHAVDVPELVVLLVAESRIDEDETGVVLDEHASQRQWNSVARVGRNTPLPQRFGDHAEHRAAVQMLAPALQGVAAQPADREGGGGHAQSAGWGVRRAGWAGEGSFRTPHSAPRTCIRSPSVTAPRSRARSNRRTRRRAVASASPPARWRARFGMPK